MLNKKFFLLIVLIACILFSVTVVNALTPLYNHSGGTYIVEYGIKKCWGETYAKYYENNEPVYHYTRAQLVVWLFGTVRVDSGRVWGWGHTYASCQGDWELVGKTYYGH